MVRRDEEDSSRLPCVLVVDDDEASRHLVEIALRGLEVEVVSCADPTAVLDLVLEWAPDAIVLDVMMPGMDGATVVKRIHEAQLEKTPKLVLWSALDSGALQQRAQECGADAVALKLAGPSVLTRQLVEWLGL